MGRQILFTVCAGLFLFSQTSFAQPKRIPFNNQQLFLNGANIAWLNFRSDLGSGAPLDTVTFGNIFLQIHNAGGNTARWWIHPDGYVTPQFSTVDSTVIGPGLNTLSDMKKVLDIAWERGIGVNLCLWTFNMLNTSNTSLMLVRNEKLLNDTNATRAYINHCLIPMVTLLKGHPAIITWEIFNEPEGMATEFGGFGGQQLVPMSVIQRFINLCAGAIHRTDPSANVTSGANNFYSLTDISIAKGSGLAKLSDVEKSGLAEFYNHKYHTSFSPDEILRRLDGIANNEALHQNYYRDDRLITAGGDPAGTLDFYSVHYYYYTGNTVISPFHHVAHSWGLTKPIVAAEFAMEDGQKNPPGIPQSAYYDTLYHLGYAGALAWSWTDSQVSSQADMLADMQFVWNNHPVDVAVNKVVFDWPAITITNPVSGASYPDSSSLTFHAAVLDTLPISSVAFYIDTIKIGSVTAPASVSSDTSFYTFRWNAIPAGTYNVTAIAMNSVGHQTVSPLIILSLGKPPMTRLEAESAAWQGSNVKVQTDPTASNGKYVDVPAQDSNTVKISWYFNNVAPAGNYTIAFGYKLAYGTPKTQYINVNGARIGSLTFDGVATSAWYEKSMNVPLVQGSNTIQMQMFWGWMYVDYLAVPRTVLTSVSSDATVPTEFSLDQNYPNPFNPTTTINFSLTTASHIKLRVYNLLGQKVATLEDRFIDAGVHQVHFDAAPCASGVYFYRLEAGKFISQKKMVLLR